MNFLTKGIRNTNMRLTNKMEKIRREISIKHNFPQRKSLNFSHLQYFSMQNYELRANALCNLVQLCVNMRNISQHVM